MDKSDYAMTLLDREAALARLRSFEKLSAVENGVELFRFKLRPGSTSTSPTISVLVQCAYLDLGRLRPRSERLEALPNHYRQLHECDLKLDAWKLVEDVLGRRDPGVMVALASFFEDQNERAYAAKHSDLYAQMVADNNETCLNCVRNCGQLSDRQTERVRIRMEKKRKPKAAAPALVVKNDQPMTDREREERAERWKQWKRDADMHAKYPDEFGPPPPEPPKP